MCIQSELLTKTKNGTLELDSKTFPNWYLVWYYPDAPEQQPKTVVELREDGDWDFEEPIFRSFGPFPTKALAEDWIKRYEEI